MFRLLAVIKLHKIERFFFCFAEAQKHSMVSVLDFVLTSFLIANELVEIWLIINDD